MGDLPAFVDTVPDYEVRKGQMHIIMGDFRLVMPVDVFQAGMVEAEAVIAKWYLKTLEKRDAKVVPMRRRSPKH